jgi:Trypsin-co-occurring domain 1
MSTRLIRLHDGTLIEVDVVPGEAQQIAGGSIAKRVESTFDQIKPTIINVCRPIADVWRELNKDVEISQTEVEIGLSFAIEGDVYIAKSKTDANLKVKLIIKPKSSIQ